MGFTAVAKRGSSHRPLVCLTLALLTLFAGATAAAPYSFEAPDQYLTRADDFAPWAALVTRQRSQRAALDACLRDAAACPASLRGYRQIIRHAPELPRLRQLRLVNRFINLRQWHVEPHQNDRWRTLTEFLSAGGDCEDYAIAKYFALRQLGFAAADVRIGIARDRETRAYHAVTVVRIEDVIYFLDVDGDPRRNRPSYRFLFSMNEDSIWDHVPKRVQEEGKPS